MTIKVLHSLSSWLPQTMTWLHSHLFTMSENDIKNIIACETVQNLEQFPMKYIYSINNETKLIYFIRKIKKKIGLVHNLPILEEIIKKEKPDIIHSHFAPEAYNNYRIAKKYNIKHVVSFYGYDVNMLPKQNGWLKKYQKIFNNIDLVLCEGEFMADSICKLGCPPNKIQVQRLGIDLNKIKFLPRKIDKKQINFLIIGTFREKKGITYALEALGILQENFNDFTVTIIGDATKEERDKTEKSKILNIITKYNLSDKVKMLGFLPYNNIIEESYNSDIFLSPSVVSSDGDTEGGAPVTIIEMAASGMPVISTTHCDIPFVLGNLNKDILVEERNSNALKDTIISLINQEIKVLDLENDNRRFIEENLDLKKCSYQLVDRYNKLLRNSL